MDEGERKWSSPAVPSRRLVKLIVGLTFVMSASIAIGSAGQQIAESSSEPMPLSDVSIIIWILSWIGVIIIGGFEVYKSNNRKVWSAASVFWIVGFAVPIVNISFSILYYFRQKELTYSRQNWDEWEKVIIFSITIISLIIVSIMIYPSSTSSNSYSYLTGVYGLAVLLLGFTPLPGFATYYDMQKLLDNFDENDWRNRITVFVLSTIMVIWLLQVPLYLLYRWGFRRTFESTLNDQAKQTIDSVNEYINTGKDRLNNEEPQKALTSFHKASQILPDSTTQHNRLSDEIIQEINTVKTRLEEELIPLATDRINQQYLTRANEEISRGETAIENEDYQAAETAFQTALEECSTAIEFLNDYGLDSTELHQLREDAKQKYQEISERRYLKQAAEIRSKIESLVEEGDQCRAEDPELALESYQTANELRQELKELSTEIELDVEAPIPAEELSDRIEQSRTRLIESEAQSHVQTAEELVSSGDAAMEDDEFDTAASKYEQAYQALLEAQSVLTDADVDADGWNLEDRLSTVKGKKGAATREQHRQAYQQPFERGKKLFETVQQELDSENYEAALSAIESSTEAFTTAADVAENHDVGSLDDIEDRLATLEDLRAQAEIGRLSERLRTASADASDTEAHEAAAEEYRAIIQAAQALDIDRERDLAVIIDEAESGVIDARVAAIEATIRQAIQAFDDDDYEEARDEFEACQERIEAVREEAAEFDIEQFNDRLDRLDAVCTDNANTARRAVLGIESDPDIVPLEDESTPSTSDPSERGAEPASSAPIPPTDDPVEQHLRDELPDHRVLYKIGSGGNADVYKVELTETNTVAALKVPRWDGTMSKSIVTEFTDEAETWAKLDDHDNIASVLEWGTMPYPWMLIEYVETSLRDRIGTLTTDESIEVLIAVANALEYAHGRGVVHLDIKPENILMDGMTPKVADWGLARMVLEHTQTLTGFSPMYSAPEQLTQQFGSVDRQTDVYQLGVLAYELLFDQPPFSGTKPADLHSKILEDTPEPPEEPNADLPPEITTVIMKALAKQRADRYEAAIQFRDDLQDCLSRIEE